MSVRSDVELQDQVIRMWMIVYEHDADRVYTFCSWRRVLASIDGSLRTWLDDCDGAETIVDAVLDTLTALDNRPFIPIVIKDKVKWDGKTATAGVVNTFVATIYGWELDAHTAIHRVLSRCYAEGGDDLKLDIMDLFNNSRR